MSSTSASLIDPDGCDRAGSNIKTDVGEIGVAIVAVFFGISVLVVGRAARVSPQAMMVAAIVTYLVKIVALAIVVSALSGTTSFSTRALGFTAIGCILVWSATQVITAVKIKMLYVEPDQQPQKQTARRGG